MEKVLIDNPFHEHPLILRENLGNEESVDCYGCGDPIIGDREWVYVCVEEKHCTNSISSGIIFHRRCGELPTQISHSSHPHHPLYLVGSYPLLGHRCNLCKRRFKRELVYRCHRCDFDLDIRCKELGRNELLGESRELQHPCHLHPLTLMKKPPFVFNCDGCGTEDRDMMYTCSTCDLLIHKTCALLPPLLFSDHHHHQLSLSSRFPFHYRNLVYKCGVCDRDFNLGTWIYYCGECRFFAHLKCAISQKQSNLEQEKNDDGPILIQFPLKECEISKELITPFVIRENGLDKIPDINDMPSSITMPNAMGSESLLFNYHMHTLSLVLELSHQEDDDDDGDEEEKDTKIKICDLCVTPISSPPYYECAPCNYFVHSICSLLPKTLSSLDFQRQCKGESHKFTLYTSLKRMDFFCWMCFYSTNGMAYICEECRMIIDVKCACLPSTIRHASHPHHKLIKTSLAKEDHRSRQICHGCGTHLYGWTGYRCTGDDCDFTLCSSCNLLPHSVMEREWDKHPLPLTYDASIDHPSDFYCGICENQMHPKEWMYHCRPCDNSFHMSCLETRSGKYKNLKFGRRFELNTIHPHPLTFSYITRTKRCYICDKIVYTSLGFMCSSCFYVACLRCGMEELFKKNM